MSALLHFEPETHTYHLGTRRLPSVTEVLRILDDWERVPKHLLDAAARFGTHVHEAAHLLIREDLDRETLDPALQGPMTALEKFVNDSGAVILESEVRVCHEVLGYAGTLDAIAFWRQGYALIDWKSGNQAPKSVGPQTAAYCEARKAMGLKAPRRRYCIRLLMDGSYKVDRLDNPADFAIFQSCLNVWKFKNRTP